MYPRSPSSPGPKPFSDSWYSPASSRARVDLLAQCVPVGQPCPPPGGFRAGFGPLVLAGGGTLRGGGPAIADLGLTPGHKSIVFGTSNGRLYVVRHDGTVAPGFPVTLPSEIVSGPGGRNAHEAGRLEGRRPSSSAMAPISPARSTREDFAPT